MVGKEFAITKVADEQQIVLGWANVSMTEDGIPIEDYQHDMIEPEELERAAYEYVLKFRDTGEGHNPKLRKKGKLVESVVFTKEKLEVMGIPEGTIPLGWGIGFKIEDKSTWDKVKKGEYTMFSIEGTGERESIEKASHNPKAMTFDEVFKFNPNHDELGRFASGPGGASGAKTTSSKMSRKQINELPDKVFSHEDFKEAAKLVSDILEEDDYGYFGLRAQEKDTETVGREMKHKSLDMTEEGSNKRLNGVSSVGVTWDGDIHRKAGNYSGRVIYLLGANRNSDELENDPGEKVLQSPTVLAKIVFHDGKMTIADRIVQKHIKAKNFDQIYSKDIEKFNPYHDEKGRFTTSDGAVSFTYKPGASNAHDKAIAREKKRHEEDEKAQHKRKEPAKLTGSEKQVSWASKIRDSRMSYIDREVKALEDNRTGYSPKTNKERKQIYLQAKDYVSSEDDAGWWIDTRSKFGDYTDFLVYADNVKRMNTRDKVPFSTLKGSPKEVNWAESIRETSIKALDNYAKTASVDKRRDYERARDYLSSQDEAKWWIDKRKDIDVPSYVMRSFGDIYTTYKKCFKSLSFKEAYMQSISKGAYLSSFFHARNM